jgi:uncharacterized protein YjbI with pentapeptide repeats
MDRDELNKILEKHRKWCCNEDGGERADLSGADLRGADLRGAYLSEAYLYRANLRGADLRRADLRGAYLSEAYLYRANLRGADLRRADLRGAYLSEADLSGAYLSGANLSGADLRGAYLRGAYLSEAYLSEADLSGANLSGANLRGADLRRADLSEANLTPFQIPQGELIVWKRCNRIMIKLCIPKRAKRTANLINRKCRAEYAKVLKVYNDEKQIQSEHDKRFIYKEGEIVRPDSYDDDIRIDCTNGIHFFLTKEEAEKW